MKIKNMLNKLVKMKIIIFIFLSIVYLVLAWRNPYENNSYISDITPGPDTFYYSIPSWNWVHGQGFKLSVYGKEIKQLAFPLYGVFLAPFFKIFNDIRSYYWTNLLLGLGSIWFFILLVDRFYKDSKIKYWIIFLTGLVFVTNYYFYSLPSLLMSENPLILVTLMTAFILLDKFSWKNLLLSVIAAIFLGLTKASAIPIIITLAFLTFLKTLKTDFWKNKKNVFLTILIVIFGLSIMFFIMKESFKNFFLLIFNGHFYSFKYLKDNIVLYLSQFLGINGHYLGKTNQQIENVIGWISLTGVLFGFFWKKYREKIFFLSVVILSVVIFHSFMYYPEGRYISTVIPLFIVFLGIIPDWFLKYEGDLAKIFVIVIMIIYFLANQTIDGHYESKLLSLQRQINNNQKGENGRSDNYIAIGVINDFFNKKEKNTYVITLLSPFYVGLFGNGNYKYLPLSQNQDFMDNGRGYQGQFIPKEFTFNQYYKKLIEEGASLYVSNHYSTVSQSWKESFDNLNEVFLLKEVKNGCNGWCKLFELEIKK